MVVSAGTPVLSGRVSFGSLLVSHRWGFGPSFSPWRSCNFGWYLSFWDKAMWFNIKHWNSGYIMLYRWSQMLGPDLLYRWLGHTQGTFWCNLSSSSPSVGQDPMVYPWSVPRFFHGHFGVQPPCSGAQESPNGARLGSPERGRDDNVAHRKKKGHGT